MNKLNRTLSAFAASMMLCGASLLLYPFAVQFRTDAQDAGMYQEIAAVARGPDAAVSEASSADTPTSDATPGDTPDAQAESAEMPAPEANNSFSALSSNPSASAESTVNRSALKIQNNDFVAWLQIPGTVIDYPVVSSDDTAFYLHHLFNGQKSKLGCLFSLTTSDYEAPSRNIAVYGHHLSTTDAMFSTLVEYKEESYYQEHPLIRLDTLHGSRSYRIFAVLNQKVTDWDASTAAFSNDAAFRQYIERAKRLSFYDTGVAVSDKDRILTLITCDRSYGGLRGRLLVMAVEEESKEEDSCIGSVMQNE